MEEADRIAEEQCKKELNWTEFTPAIVAQMAEQEFCKLQVDGSIPSDGLESMAER